MSVINYDDIKVNRSSNSTNNNVLDYNSLFNIKSKKISNTKSKKKKKKNLLDTVTDTVGMAVTNIAEGVGNTIEGIADTGAMVAKEVGKAMSNPLGTVEKLLTGKSNNPITTIADKKIVETIGGKDALDYENNPLYQLGEQMEKDKVVETITKPMEDKFEENSLIKKDGLASNVLQGIGQVAGMAINPLGVSNTAINLGSKTLPVASGTKTMFMSTLGNSYTKAKQDGADDNEAMLYGLLSAGKETATEAIYGGLGKAFGKGALDDVVKNKATSMIKNKIGKKATELGIGMTAEGLEEVASSLTEPFIQRVYKEKNDVDPITFDGLLNDFISGALVSGVMQGIDGISNIGNNNQNKNNINELSNNTTNTEIQNNYQYQQSNNSKIDNLRKSASKYFNNSNETNSLINTYEKIINDKNYNVLFDDTITNNNGNIVDAKISNLNNGEIEIKINPNSQKAGEFLIMHEVTHAIETNEMRNLVTDYASKHSDFNEALESLKQVYGTNDVSSEVLADISGQLFGNQEFINNLSIQKPNVFKRIYNKIIELANKITGNSKESFFIKDLKNKWETAYRTQNNNLNDDSMYMMTGVKGLKNAVDNNVNNQWLKENYDNSKMLRENGYDNETIRQKTGWFIGKDGKERFEISDNEATISNKIKQNSKYKLSQILSHDDLYELYPKLKNINVNIKNIKDYKGKTIAGQFSTLTNSIDINNKLLNMSNSSEKVKSTLLHEIQHYIQKSEKFNKGSSGRNGMNEYINNLGEIEARDTENRMNMSIEDRLENLPKSIKTMNSVENKANTLYNLGKRKDIKLNENEFSKENIQKIYNEKSRSNRLYDRNGQNVRELSTIQNNSDTKNKESRVNGDENEKSFREKREELDDSSFNLGEKSLPKYSDINNNWQKYLESNYKATGTRTYMEDIKGKLPTNNLNIKKEIPKNPTKESTYDNVDNYNQEINSINDMLSNYTELERKDLISEQTYDSISGELRKLGKDLDDKSIDSLSNKVFKMLIDGKDKKYIATSIYNSINNTRKTKVNEYRKQAEHMIDDIVNWNDKKLGISYQTETMKRNIYDIIPDKNKAKKVYETYFQTISENEAKAKKEINSYNEKIKSLNLNNKESVAVQMYGEYKYNPETKLTGMQVDEYISKNKLDIDKIKNSVEVFRDTYDELINKVNNVLIEQGYKPIEYRKGYFPHFTTDKPNTVIGKFAEKLGWKINKNNLPTDIAGMTEIFKPGKRWTSFSQERTGDATDYNALKGFDNYIRGAADLIYHTEDIQKLRALENEIRYQYSSDKIKKEIDSIHNDSDLDVSEKQEEIDKIYQKFNNQMPNFVTELRRFTDGLANKKAIDDRNMEHKLNREVYSVMTNIQNRVSANMVGLNVSSAFTNFIPITQGYSKISTKNMLKAIKSTISNQVRNDGFENNSTFLTNRLNNPDTLYKSGLDKFNDKASFLFEGIDSITSNILVRGKYYDNIDNGMTEIEAIKNDDEFAKDVMAGRSKGELPTIYNEKNPITKLFTSFQLEVKNQYGYMFKDIPRDLKDKGMQTLIKAFFKMFAGAWLYNKFAEPLTGKKSAFSPIDIVEETLSTATNKNLSTYDKLENIATNLLQELPFVGGLLGGGRLPINSAIPDVKTFEYLANSFSDDADKKKKAINNLKKELSKPLMYIALPVGGGQIKKTYEGLSMYSKNKDVKGSYTTSGELRFPVKEDILSKTQAAIFGQYSSKEAREYFDRGETPLTEKQIESYKKLNVPITKYWKYRQDLKEINKIKGDKDEEGKTISGSASGKKAYEIMNNKLYSNKEKNYLLSELSNSENKETIESLKILKNDKDSYKYYYSLSNESKKSFKEAIEKYNFTAKQLTEFNNSIDKSDSTTKNQSIVKYLINSNFSDEQICYLYEKNGYSSTEKLRSITNSNISIKSYLDLQSRIRDIKGNIDLENKEEGKTISGSKKKKVLKEINETNGFSKEQKLLIAYLEGYSISTGDFIGYSKDSSRKIVFDYVNNLKLSINEKREILDKAGYKMYKNGRIGW